MVNGMNFYVTAEPKHMDHLHAFYVAGRIVDSPSVKLKLPRILGKANKFTENERNNEFLARTVMNAYYEINREPKVIFDISNYKGGEHHLFLRENTIKARRPYSGDSLEVDFGPCPSEAVQTVHDELKDFIEEAEKRIPKVEGIGGESHFHVTVAPNPKLFTGPKEVNSKKIEKVLSEKGLERTGEIVHFDVCGFNGYIGRICGLAKDEVPFGVIEWEHGERSGIWNRHYLYPLRKSKKSS